MAEQSFMRVEEVATELGIYFDKDSPMIEVITYNTDLKKRLSALAEQYPKECKQLDDDGLGCKVFEVRKGRFGFKLTPPYTEERRKAASELWQRTTP